VGYKVRRSKIRNVLMKQRFLMPPIRDCERTPLMFMVLGEIKAVLESPALPHVRQFTVGPLLRTSLLPLR
jgi:hypothetical protein